MMIPVINKRTQAVFADANGTLLSVHADDTANHVKDKVFCMASDQGLWYSPLVLLELHLDTGEHVAVKSEHLSNTLVNVAAGSTAHENARITNVSLMSLLDYLDTGDVNIHGALLSDDVLMEAAEACRRAGFDVDSDLASGSLFVFALKLTLLKKNASTTDAYLSADKEAEYRRDTMNVVHLILAEKERARDAVVSAQLPQFDEALASEEPAGLFQTPPQYLQVQFVVQNDTGGVMDLALVFRTFALSTDVPFVAISGTFFARKQPLLRIHNELLSVVSEDALKSWFITERKRAGQWSYKKIKGLLFKVSLRGGAFASVSVDANGTLTIKLLEDDIQPTAFRSLQDIWDVVKDPLEALVAQLNGTAQAFRGTGRLSIAWHRTRAVSARFTSTQRLNKQSMADVLSKHRILSDNVFEQKDTLGQDTFSLYYKRTGYPDLLADDQPERRGITVSIKDNPDRLNSSVVTVYGAFSSMQVNVILEDVRAVCALAKQLDAPSTGDDDSDFEVSEEEHKIRTKSNIKALKEQGVKVLSTNCQKQRQPVVVDAEAAVVPFPDSYPLIHDGKKYVCTNPQYPFPGFTNENIVCCFKKDQRRKEPFIRNMQSESLEILVQPSNHVITVAFADGTTITGHAIRRSVEGRHVYNVIDQGGSMREVNDPALVQELYEQDEEAWLDTVPLSKVLSPPPKNKCNFPPDLTRRTDANVNSPCDGYPHKKYFGYNLNSFPCCFDKPRGKTMRRRREADITKQHIIKTDKTLEVNRLGTLPPSVQALVDSVAEDAAKYYRMGVLPGARSFLNAVAATMDPPLPAQQLLEHMRDRLGRDPALFQTLNEGDLALVFNSQEEYLRFLDGVETDASPKPVAFLIDLASNVANTRFMVFDVTEQGKTRLACHRNAAPASAGLRYAVLLRKNDHFEVVVKLEHETDNGAGTLHRSFSDANELVRAISSFRNATCTVENVYPEGFPFVPAPEGRLVISELMPTPDAIVFQIANAFNKVGLLVTRSGAVLPVREMGVQSGIPSVDTVMPTAAREYDAIRTLAAKYASLAGLEVTGQVVHEGRVVALATNVGIVLPTKPSDLLAGVRLADPALRHHARDVDTALKLARPPSDARAEYSGSTTRSNKQLVSIKSAIGEALSGAPDIKARVRSAVLNNGFSREQRFSSVLAEVSAALPDSSKLDPGLLKAAVNDIVNDTTEFSILNNMVFQADFDENSIVKRDTESIVLDVDDLRKWVRRNKK